MASSQCLEKYRGTIQYSETWLHTKNALNGFFFHLIDNHKYCLRSIKFRASGKESKWRKRMDYNQDQKVKRNKTKNRRWSESNENKRSRVKCLASKKAEEVCSDIYTRNNLYTQATLFGIFLSWDLEQIAAHLMLT